MLMFGFFFLFVLLCLPLDEPRPSSEIKYDVFVLVRMWNVVVAMCFVMMRFISTLARAHYWTRLLEPSAFLNFESLMFQ
jgi:hypothetical protein